MVALFLSACLKTRTDVTQLDQNSTYGKKNAENQIESQIESNANQTSALEDKDMLIRDLNGRVEVLEQQLSDLKKTKDEMKAKEETKLTLLQEAVSTMQSQIQKLESELNESRKINESLLKSSDDVEVTDTVKNKKQNTYDQAEEQFKKKEWKKAIISYQKYTDNFPKGKHIADAKYKIGLCFQELGMKEEAMAFYEEVVANYEKTEAGKKSKTRLAKLKK